ncbi:MAG: ComF family protein [Muribaculaceae bacterium]|nr:ComF family protein [Muribaculaceae bacterium]
MIPLLGHLVNFMFPPECHVCGIRLAPHERFACTGCLRKLPRSGYHRRHLNPMEERFAGLFRFTRATGHFFYTRDSSLSTLIQDMKYRRFPGIGDMLGNLAATELYPTGFFSDTDIVVPVPMHFVKQARRGYNQTDHIARGIGEAAGLPVVRALKATKPHRTQTSLTREERLANTTDIFTVANPGLIEGKGVLLVDDVCTTGATIISASEAIWTASPSSLSIFTLGVTF